MDERLVELAAAGLVLTREAREMGVSEDALRWAVSSGDLIRVARGAYLAPGESGPPSDPRTRHVALIRAALARCGPQAAAAGASAGVLHGLPSPRPAPALPVILRPRTTARPEHGERGRATVNRRAWLAADEVCLVEGIPTTTPARTFVDLARHLPPTWGLAVADVVLRDHAVTRSTLLAQAARHVRSPGAERARRLAGWASAQSESPLESVARAIVLGAGLPEPSLQAWIGQTHPEYRVDMLFDDFFTVVEVDGKLKYVDDERRWADKRRQDRLLELGYDVHRFVWTDQHRPRLWLAALEATFARSLRRRALPAPPTWQAKAG